MNYTIKVLEKDFQHEVSKEAYLKACGWVATHVINKEEEMGRCFWNISKISGTGEIPTFKLKVYATLSEEEIREKHCEICKQVHNLFYMNHDKSHCSECKLKAYFIRVEEAMADRKKLIKEKIKKW